MAPWHGGARGRQQTEEMLMRQAAQEAARGFCLWWWRERSSGELVGFAGLNQDEVEGEPAVEVGWSIVPRRWGEGLATEAARASIDWGFGRVGLTEIVSFAVPGNRPSRRVMEKTRMEYVRDIDRRELPHVLYRIAV